MDTLNAMLEGNEIPQSLKKTLRSYFVYSKAHYTQEQRDKVKSLMSPGLRQKFIIQDQQKFFEVEKEMLFPNLHENTQTDLLTQLAHRFVTRTLPPYECLIREGDPATQLFLIRKGFVSEQTKSVMIPHAPEYVLGHDFILRYSALSRRYYKAYSLTHIEYLTLHQDHFYQVLSNIQFIQARAEIRRRVGRLLVLRWVLATNAKNQLEKVKHLPTMVERFAHVEKKYPLGVRILKLIRADFLLKRTSELSKRNNAIYQDFFPASDLLDAKEQRLSGKARGKRRKRSGGAGKKNSEKKVDDSLQSIFARQNDMQESLEEVTQQVMRISTVLNHICSVSGLHDV